MKKEYIDSLKEFVQVIKAKADEDMLFLSSIICVNPESCKKAIDFFVTIKINRFMENKIRASVFTDALERDVVDYDGYRVLFYLNDSNDNSFDKQASEYMPKETSIEYARRVMKDDEHIMDIIQDEDMNALYKIYKDRIMNNIKAFIAKEAA